jgi:salicylate hydroxylase
VKSVARTVVLGYEDKPKSSGYAIYRAFFPGDLLRNDPAVSHFVEKDSINVWIGPDMHGFVTTLRGGEEVNWVLTHKDTRDVDEGWVEPGDMTDVIALMNGWDPQFRRVVEKCEECLDWKLVYRDPLPTVCRFVNVPLTR